MLHFVLRNLRVLIAWHFPLFGEEPVLSPPKEGHLRICGRWQHANAKNPSQSPFSKGGSGTRKSLVERINAELVVRCNS